MCGHLLLFLWNLWYVECLFPVYSIDKNKTKILRGEKSMKSYSENIKCDKYDQFQCWIIRESPSDFLRHQTLHIQIFT